MTIKQVHIDAVRHRAEDAITRRLGYFAPNALVAVDRDSDRPGTVIVHVNSGGNAIEVERALREAGYHVSTYPGDAKLVTAYGVKMRVEPGQAEVTR